jgi:hypothetical protein
MKLLVIQVSAQAAVQRHNLAPLPWTRTTYQHDTVLQKHARAAETSAVRMRPASCGLKPYLRGILYQRLRNYPFLFLVSKCHKTESRSLADANSLLDAEVESRNRVWSAAARVGMCGRRATADSGPTILRVTTSLSFRLSKAKWTRNCVSSASCHIRRISLL